jgi:ribosome-associated protein
LNLSTSPGAEPSGQDQAEELEQLLTAAVRAADAKLASDIVILDVAEVLSVVDCFIIGSGRNTRQVATIVEEIEDAIKRAVGRSPLRIEGLRDATWVLMDYGDVVVHVFLEETREYYDLEHLWSTTPRIPVAPRLAERAESA